MNSEQNISDNLLIISIRNGSKDAFKLLYDRYCKKLFYFSLRYLDDKEEAEELVQSVFINIWEHRNSLNETLSVKNYIYRSALNYIYNYLKKKAVHARYVEAELRKSEPQSNQTYNNIFYNDLERSISSIVEKLPLQQRKIFQLSRFDGLSHEEIARTLNLTVRTVENHIYRALKIIKSKLRSGVLFLFLLF